MQQGARIPVLPPSWLILDRTSALRPHTGLELNTECRDS